MPAPPSCWNLGKAFRKKINITSKSKSNQNLFIICRFCCILTAIMSCDWVNSGWWDIQKFLVGFVQIPEVALVANGCQTLPPLLRWLRPCTEKKLAIWAKNSLNKAYRLRTNSVNCFNVVYTCTKTETLGILTLIYLTFNAVRTLNDLPVSCSECLMKHRNIFIFENRASWRFFNYPNNILAYLFYFVKNRF